MRKDDLKLLNLLESLPLVAQRLQPELQDPAVQKRFVSNVCLLMGACNVTAAEVAKQSGINISTLSRILNPKPNSPTKFERVNILTFVSIAKTLGVTVHTILFVDLNEKLSKIIEEEKKECKSF